MAGTGRHIARGKGAVAAGAALPMLAATVAAQPSGTQIPALEGLEVEARLGETVPADAEFLNARGETVTIGSYYDRGKPIVLSLVYFDCPMLCNLMTDGLVETLSQMDWTPGDEFTVLTASFNYREGPDVASRARAMYLGMLGRPEAGEGWHFLTGSKESIAEITGSVGFKFRWMEETSQFAHPATLIFLSPDGVITRYLYGLERTPREMRNALVEAGNGAVGNVIDSVILYCFQYDPDARGYVAQAFNIMRLGGVITMILLGTALFIFWRREANALD